MRDKDLLSIEIEDEEDFDRNFDDIQYNPVRQRLVGWVRDFGRGRVSSVACVRGGYLPVYGGGSVPALRVEIEQSPVEP